MLRPIPAINIALLTEGECYAGFPRTLPVPLNKHGPPNGGRMLRPITAINMALLTEGECYVRFLL